MGRSKSWFIPLLTAVALLGVLLTRQPVERAAVPGQIPAATPVLTALEPASAPEAASRAPLAVEAPAAPDVEAAPAAAATSEAGAVDAQDENPHPGSRLEEAAIVRLHGERPLTVEHPAMKSAIEIQERHTRWLMAHPGVVGTAVGLNDEGRIALIVYTKVAEPNLPGEIEGLPLAPYNSGELFARLGKQDARAKGGKPGGGGGGEEPPAVDPTARFPRPVPIGVSTGHPDITAGTIGCRVKDAAGLLYALSNNHVYANENAAAIGNDVLQPGPFDGGVDPDDSIGTLADFQEILFGGSDNRIDAAIARSVDVGNATPSGGYGTPRSTPELGAVGMMVKKYGRTTGQTRGKLSALNATVNVGYDAGVARFVGQMVISNFKGKNFSAGGDSGSLIVSDSDDNVPMGLLFAGSQTTTIGNVIGDVLTRFGVTIDGK